MAGSTDRLNWVDAAKALCIILVVMMHSTLGVEKAAGETGWMGAVVAFAQPFRIPTFFVISGLFLTRIIDRPWRGFLDRRVVHFAYFYVLWLVIQFAFKAPGMVAESSAAETPRLFVLSLTVEPFGTLWFLWMLPVFALTVRLTRHIPLATVFAIAIALEIAPIATGFVAVDEFASRFVYFLAGYALAPAIFRFVGWVGAAPRLALAALLAWAALEAAAVYSGVAALPLVSLALGALGALAVVAAALLITALPRAGSLLCFVGANSLVIYLAFFLPMAASRVLLLKSGVITDIGTISLLVTIAGVTMPFAIWWTALRTGGRFLFERPHWARIEARHVRRTLAPI